MEWEKEALKKFTTMIERIPLFHRQIAQQVVHKKAEFNCQERGGALVEESDIVQAFFSEVPLAFYSLMVRLLDEVGFNYKPYKPC
jgi:hypothetical protein